VFDSVVRKPAACLVEEVVPASDSLQERVEIVNGQAGGCLQPLDPRVEISRRFHPQCLSGEKRADFTANPRSVFSLVVFEVSVGSSVVYTTRTFMRWRTRAETVCSMQVQVS
jgi:hypothetical protein